MNFINRFCKAYWTGASMIMRLWFKIFVTPTNYSIASVLIGLATLIGFIIVALKWGLLHAIWVTILITAAQQIVTLATGTIGILFGVKPSEGVIEVIMEGATWMTSDKDDTLHDIFQANADAVKDIFKPDTVAPEAQS